MSLGFETYLAAVFLLALFVVPLPGVQKETSIQVGDEDIEFELHENHTIYDGAIGRTYYLDGGSPRFAKIHVATDWRPLWDYLSTCSHEVKHVKLERSGKEEHEIIHNQEVLGVLGGVLPPWAWERQCFNVLDDRLFL